MCMWHPLNAVLIVGVLKSVIASPDHQHQCSKKLLEIKTSGIFHAEAKPVHGI